MPTVLYGMIRLRQHIFNALLVGGVQHDEGHDHVVVDHGAEGRGQATQPPGRRGSGLAAQRLYHPRSFRL